MSKELNYSALFIKDQGGSYSVFAPALPGCHSQGETLVEAKANIIEVAELYLETLAADDEAIPIEHEISQQKISVANPAL